jgi:hypothetical protein
MLASSYSICGRLRFAARLHESERLDEEVDRTASLLFLTLRYNV